MTSIWYRVHMYVGSYDEKFLKVFVLYPTIFFVFEETLTCTWLATEDTGNNRHYSTQHKSATVIQASYRGYR